MGEHKANLPHDISRAFHDLRDKFKHGHHIIKILESQLETARQNISLLQGQIRLANETIDNLKQQFSEADMTLGYLTDNYKDYNERKIDSGRQVIRDIDEYSHGSVYISRNDELEAHRRVMEYDKHSPKNTSSLPKVNEAIISESDHHDRSRSPSLNDKSGYIHERPKSPYAQQLRQVLDALQDEDSRKIIVSSSQELHRDITTASSSQPQLCMCPECVPGSTSHRHFQSDSVPRSSACGCDVSGNEVRYNEDCAKHMSKGNVRSNEDTSVHQSNGRSDAVHQDGISVSHTANVSHSTNPSDYSTQCTGPCCSSIDLSKGYKVVEKSPGLPHYIAPRSPRHRKKQIELRHEPNCQMVGHCDDNCRCHAYVNYAPFGYQVVESSPGVPQTIQPISPSIVTKKNKRYTPLAPGDEPPHLKYTKVKRIDGSKVAAQKTIQDFSKRRLQPYNPRWDLDLLIVPPPMPASELFDVLALEQESKKPKDHVVAENPFSNEEFPVANNSFRNPSIKSKVINAGGTVIVLTDCGQQPRVCSTPVTLPSPGHGQLVTKLQQSGSFLSQSTAAEDSFKDKAEVNRNDTLNGLKLDKDEPMDVAETYSDPSGLQISNADKAMDEEGSPDFYKTKQLTPDISSKFNKSVSIIAAGTISKYGTRESAQGSLPATSTVNIKRERNNNSYSDRAVTRSSPNCNPDPTVESTRESSSNLTSRYEKVLLQRNQDFSKLGNDEEFVMNNRSKGKVH